MPGPIQFQAVGKSKFKRGTLEATITRADGTVEHLGIIADSSKFHRATTWSKRILAKLF